MIRLTYLLVDELFFIIFSEKGSYTKNCTHELILKYRFSNLNKQTACHVLHPLR